jgi:hypothetical protein
MPAATSPGDLPQIHFVRNRTPREGRTVPPTVARILSLLLDNGGSHAASASMHRRHRAIAARGVHRLTVYVDPTAQTVLVRFASFPKAQNGLIDLTSPPVYQAVAEYLMAK